MAIKKLIALGCALVMSFPLVACGNLHDNDNVKPGPSSGTGENGNGENGNGENGNGENGNGENGNGENGNGENGNGENGNGENGNGGVVKLTFNTGDGAFISGGNSVVLDGNGNTSALTSKGDPRLSGYAFAGWYNGTQLYDASKKYTKSTTFTAKYDSGAESVVYDALFDEGSTVKIAIDMSDAQWKKLNQDYIDFGNGNGKSPIYRMADWVTISIEEDDGTTRDYWYDEVGIRMKGNTSRRTFYGDDGFYANVHYKISFKQTFDDEVEYKADERKTWNDKDARKARKNRLFGGMEKFDVKYNKNEDDTYCRDIYAMKMFRENGIIVPDTSLCAITARNKGNDFINLGVYTIYEAVDETMLLRHLPDDADGDLYKCSWGSGNIGADLTLSSMSSIGVENELNYEFYTYDKKTNKKKGHTNLENFITAINQENPNFANLIDEDYFAKFEAVNYLLGNPDCIRNNKNNYYIYFRKDGRAIFIPYDYDRCLGITKDYNPDGSACTNLAPFTRSTANDGNSGSQANPLYVKLIDKSAPYGEGSVLMKYRANLISIANGNMFNITAFNNFKNSYASRYGSLVNGALGTNNVAFGDNRGGNMSVENYINAKKNTLNNNIDNYLQ